MKKSRVLILHDSEKAKTSLEELGLYLLQDYEFEFLNIAEYSKNN
ncbi:MAG: hypothetical protein ACRCW5_08420 [Cetobacterium sp.]